MVSTIKFSEFANSTKILSNNKNVGLSNGLNAQSDLTVTWTTAARPSPAYNGLLGYNTDLSDYEFWDSVSSAWIALGGGGSGSVTSVATGTGLTGGPITGTGTISFASITANSLWANITGGVAVPTVIPTATWLFTANNLSDVPSKPTARINLGLQIGVDVEAWSPALDSIAGLTTGANNLIYTTASNAYSTISSLASAVLITSAGNVPSLSQTLPTTVQNNITFLGALGEALNMNSHQINNVTDPTNPQDAATLAYVTAQTTGMFLPLLGGTMTGAINMGNHKITNMTDPSAAQDAVTINYLNTQLAGYLSLSGGTMTGAINMGSLKITNLLDPTNPQDAATKNYVDLVATGLTVQPACYAATTGNLNAIYANAASGIGATLVNNGALAQFATDGFSPPTNARILVWSQSSTLENGIYTLTNQGSGAVAWILTRATDYDQPAEIQPGDLVIINNGTLYGGSSFIETASVAAIGTDPILFSQFTFSATAVLLKANNLSDVANTTTAFNNISPLSTKGDLIGYSSQNIRVAVGSTNAQILQVNSAATAGISWSTATYPVTTTVNQILYSSATNVIGGISSIAGGVLVTDASSVPSLLANPGAAGKVLQSANAAIPTWSTPTYPSASGTSGLFLISNGTNNVYSTSTIPTSAGATANKVLLSDGTNYVLSTPTFPNASATSGKFIRSDGTNWVASTPTLPTSAGAAGKILASDGTNYVESTPTFPYSASATVRKIIVSDGTNWVASTETYAIPGTSGNVLTSNGTNWISSAATGTGTVNSGLINQLAYYAAAGTAVSGVSIVNSAVLTTTSGGVPTWVAYTGTNAPVLGTAPTISQPLINQINDQSNNLKVMAFTGVASAVNYIDAANAATGNGVSIAALGTDSNIGLNLNSKGTSNVSMFSNGALAFYATNPASAVNFFGVSGSATGNKVAQYALGSDSNIIFQINGKGTGGVEIKGTSTNDSAAAGYVGEFMSASNLAASPIVFTTGIPKTLQSVTLTAGDWIVWGNIFWTATTETSLAVGLSTTTNTLPDASVTQRINPTVTANNGLSAPMLRFSVSGSTTVYLVGQVTGTGTMNGSGGIYALRTR